ncbi:GEMI7 protein, partial [Urocolius indicus]|nr:GEMI7 protein [Urocolius indicus]
ASSPIPVPVGVLRLPRGPDGSSRGFNPNSPRFQELFGAGGCAGGSLGGSAAAAAAVQGARAALRRRFLRALALAGGRPARFRLRGGGGCVGAVLGAVDVESVAVQVDSLQTPLGVEAAALLRCQDLVAYSFLL